MQGDLAVTGSITATKLHVDEITADVRNERTSPLEFQGGHGKGLIWTGVGHTRQFTFQPNPDKLFSSEHIDLNREKSYMIEGIPVLEFTKLGDSVTNSKLTSVGTLKNLRLEGSLNVDEYVVNKKILSDDIKMIHEFIEFKYFKRIMKGNKNIFE